MLNTYPSDGVDVQITALNGYAFQLTNSLNQLVANDSDFSNIDLGECEKLLKTTYGIPQNISLIFFKYEKIIRTGNERDIQYEVYNPLNYEQLDLSICLNKMKITMNIELDEETIEKLKNIIDQGYDPLDLNDKFYREICTPYNSENGTDVLLDDRQEYVFSTIVNETTCPTGCEMSSYSLDSKYVTCECDTNDGIVPLDYNNLNADNVLASFLSSLKNTNYKVMRCYNLVFNFKIFCHNYGSIITLIFFIIYVIFMIYYSCKTISPIKISISKLLFDEQKKEGENELNGMKKITFGTKSEKSKKGTKSVKSTKTGKSSKSKKKKQNKSTKNNPPRKGRIRKVQNTEAGNNNNSFERKRKAGDLKLVDIMKTKRHSIKNRPHKDDESVKSDKVRQRKSIIDYQNELILKTRENLLQMQLNGKVDSKTNMNLYSYKPSEENTIIDKEKEKNFDDYELNHMGYFDASEYDKRSCFRTYWSVILREHYVLFTFLSRNDHNLFYVKIERFFILICTEMTMNGMFFVHETMYKKKSGGDSFAQKIPQIIFSLLVSHFIEVILCFLGMTDSHYYEIKNLPKIDKNKEKDQYNGIYDKHNKKEKTDDRIFDILNKMQRKLTAFFVFTFLLFLFHWYFISAFCAVYQNTQIIYLRDSGIGILTSLIDPFIIYGLTCILRAISLLLCCRKKLGCVYKISELIPIF